MRKRQARKHPVLGAGEVGLQLIAQTCRLHAAIAQRSAGAADQVPIAGRLHVLGQTGPQQQDRAAGAVVRMDAGATDFDQRRAQMGQPRQVELVFRIQLAQLAGLVRRQNPIGSDDPRGVVVTNDQVVAVRIELVLVKGVIGLAQLRAHFLREYLIAQALGILDTGWPPRQPDRQSRFAHQLLMRRFQQRGALRVTCGHGWFP